MKSDVAIPCYNPLILTVYWCRSPVCLQCRLVNRWLSLQVFIPIMQRCTLTVFQANICACDAVIVSRANRARFGLLAPSNRRGGRIRTRGSRTCRPSARAGGRSSVRVCARFDQTHRGLAQTRTERPTPYRSVKGKAKKAWNQISRRFEFWMRPFVESH